MKERTCFLVVMVCVCIFDITVGAVISGSVVSANNESTVTRGAVSLVRTDGDEILMKSSRIGPEGEYVISDVAPGAYQVLARADGYDIAAEDITITNVEDIVNIDFHLVELAILEGTVTYDDGEPASNVSLFLAYPSAVLRGHVIDFKTERNNVTDNEGGFRLGVRPNIPVILRVVEKSGRSYEIPTPELNSGERVSGWHIILDR